MRRYVDMLHLVLQPPIRPFLIDGSIRFWCASPPSSRFLLSFFDLPLSGPFRGLCWPRKFQAVPSPPSSRFLISFFDLPLSGPFRLFCWPRKFQAVPSPFASFLSRSIQSFSLLSIKMGWLNISPLLPHFFNSLTNFHNLLESGTATTFRLLLSFSFFLTCINPLPC